MKKIKAFFFGSLVALLNLIILALPLWRPELCGSTCGNCGMSCLTMVVKLVLTGLGILILQRVQKILNSITSGIRKWFAGMKKHHIS